METARDLNMETDEMQLVISALRGVGKRIVEVAQTHKPLFAGEHFLTGKEVCERLYISPRTLQDYRDRRIIPLHAVCREDTLQSFGLGKNAGGELQVRGLILYN